VTGCECKLVRADEILVGDRLPSVTTGGVKVANVRHYPEHGTVRLGAENFGDLRLPADALVTVERPAPKPVVVGDRVRLRGTKKTGEVLAVDGGYLWVLWDAQPRPETTLRDGVERQS
jgi:hypothetical protein